MRQVAFLRAVNVGRRSVRMQALREAFGALGWPHARTFIASGNVIFDPAGADAAALEAHIEAGLAATFGFDIDVFVRSLAQLHATVRAAAVDPVAAGAVSHVIGFLKAPARPADRRLAGTWDNGVDRVRLAGRELHWISSARQSESVLSAAVFERALGQRITLRGVTTLRRLVQRHPCAAPDANGWRTGTQRGA